VAESRRNTSPLAASLQPSSARRRIYEPLRISRNVKDTLFDIKTLHHVIGAFTTRPDRIARELLNANSAPASPMKSSSPVSPPRGDRLSPERRIESREPKIICSLESGGKG